MDNITIQFAVALNVSLQVGDIAFYKSVNDQIYLIGAVTNITNNSISCDIGNYTPRPDINDFIFFVKDEEINKTGLLGHYGEITLACTPGAGENPEVFAINSEVSISS